jgi:hypothetical protein
LLLSICVVKVWLGKRLLILHIRILIIIPAGKQHPRVFVNKALLSDCASQLHSSSCGTYDGRRLAVVSQATMCKGWMLMIKSKQAPSMQDGECDLLAIQPQLELARPCVTQLVERRNVLWTHPRPALTPGLPPIL